MGDLKYIDKADALHGGWRTPRSNPAVAMMGLFVVANERTVTAEDQKAFRKRVKKRRAKKGYR